MWRRIIWDSDPDGNSDHIADHGLSEEEVDHVLFNAATEDVSRSSGLPCVFGYTHTGRYIIVIYEEIDEDTVMPVTAFELE